MSVPFKKDPVEFNQRKLLATNVFDLLPEDDDCFLPSLASQNESREILQFISEISNLINKEISEARWFEEIYEEYLSGNIKSWIFRIKKYGFKHFLKFCKWLISPFVIRCYIGLLKQKLKKI